MRSARELLRWSRDRLGALSQTSAQFVTAYENTGRLLASKTGDEPIEYLAAIRVALEASGVEFIEDRGSSVRMRKAGQ